jgi:hypothetical protein
MTKSAENIEKKIEAQLEKLKQLKAQKQAIDAREKTKQKEQERKDDTRRKILLGSYLIKKMQSNEANKEKILVDRYFAWFFSLQIKLQQAQSCPTLKHGFSHLSKHRAEISHKRFYVK